MKNERWKTIEELFHAARGLKEEDRAKFFDEHCGADVAMRNKVEALLRNDDHSETLLDTPAVDLIATTLSPGTVLGPYEVVSVAGAGAMGQVYRAWDRRLKRDVAIKALPVEFAHDTERLARLHREATVLASVNHPNIAAIYDVVESRDGDTCLILEFVDGLTLAARLQQGPLSPDEAVPIAHQIALALEAAHEKGIVHRDLKPANIKVTPGGKVKVLDFGLAKAFKEGVANIDLGHPPLSESSRDYTGFGTPAYMSPEQARGIPVDQSADLWAFGCVVYELLTGTRAFQGRTVRDTLTSILAAEPDWTLLPADTPSKLRYLLRQCLQKHVNERFQNASDLRRKVAEIETERNLTERQLVPPESPVRRQKHWVATVLAVTALAALTGLLAMLNWRETGDLRVEQTRQVTFAPELELDPAISPDGKMVAYVLDSGTRIDIYIRSLAGGEPTNLTKDLVTIAHRWPQWSPDGTEIAFLATSPGQRLADFATTEHTIQVVRLPGGAPRTITNASMRGFAWSSDGTKIAFVRDSDIYVISAAGTGLRRIAEGYEPHALSWSPDGKWIAYVCGNVLSLFGPNMFGNVAPSFIAIVSADGGEARQLTDSRTTNTSPVWMPDSRSLLFLSNRGGSRDVFHVRLSDTAEALAEPRRITTGLNALSIHLSHDGRQLAYSLFLSKANLWSLALPESGPVSPAEAKPVTTGAQSIEGVSISRDGKWIAFDSNRNGNQDIYRIPREGGQPEQLTTDPSDDFLPAWSWDGHSIAFHSFRNGNRDIYVMSADGTGQQQVTSDPAQERYPQWSPDGRSLTFNSDKTRRQEIYTVTRENGGWGQPRQLTSSEGAQVPRWSPDGESIAYIDLVKGLSVISPTGRTLRHLVNVRPPFDPKFVAWSSDSKTIYYKAGSLRGSFWSVPASGGSPTQLVQFDDARNFARIEFDLLEKELFFTMTQRESDIWILELR